ncbi:RraA family protein [Paenibacillus piri]|nr:RraA family protein [Paenibacillus piri]
MAAAQKLTDQELIEKIRKVRLADLSDGMDALGLVNVGSMSTDMRPLRPGIAFAGFAYTVKLIKSQEPVIPSSSVEEYFKKNGEWCREVYTFDRIMKNDDITDKVLVIDMDGYPGGVLGSDNMLAYKFRGMAGAVVDGGCRDSFECNLEEVNVFSTRRTFHHVSFRLAHGGVNIPVQCAGVTVHPGDVICADDDGVLVIPRNRAEEVLEFAIAILQADQKARTAKYEALGMQPDYTLNRLGE